MFRFVNRVSVNVLLKSVIAIMAATVMIAMALNARGAWNRLAVVNRIVAVADVTADLFTALHNLRLDASTTNRNLSSEVQYTAVDPVLVKIRAVDMAAMTSALAGLQKTDFPKQHAAVAALSDAIKKLTQRHQETATALLQPKSARPAGLAKEYVGEVKAVLALIESISDQLTQSVKLEDSYIDQLLVMKHLAWTARNAAGDAAVLISNTLSGLPLPQDALLQYRTKDATVQTAWEELQAITSGLSVPASFTAALDKANNEYFGPDHTKLRYNMLDTLIAHRPVTVKTADWVKMSIEKLATMLGVAEAALNSAKEYAAKQRHDTSLELWLDLAMLAAAAAVMVGMMVMVSRRVTGPLRNIQQAMLKVAGGDFSVVLPGLERKDEIGDVANAVERFKVLADEKARAEAAEAVKRQQVEADRLAQITNAEAAAQTKVAEERAKIAEEQTQAVKALGVGLVRLSEGDLTFRLTQAFPEAYQELKDNFNATMERLQETVRSLTESAREVTGASAEISASTTDLSQRTEEQAASLEETSASMEEIAGKVKKNAENAQQANASAGATRDVADRGGQVVAKAVDAMAKIEDSSRKISDIIGVIDEIARQTNLLALNAAVEAARAGEAGRGFAVVASEVRSLAQRSSQAAKDIKDLITNSNGQVKDGVELVNRAGASLTEIVETIKKVAEIVADIANASAEQASGIEQVNKALTQMDEVTQQNSALVEENAATAKTLEHQAKAMDERVSFFKLASTAEERQAAQPAAARVQRPAAAAPSRGPAAKQQPVTAPKRAAASNTGGPVRRMQTALATAVKSEPDWKEF